LQLLLIIHDQSLVSGWGAWEFSDWDLPIIRYWLRATYPAYSTMNVLSKTFLWDKRLNRIARIIDATDMVSHDIFNGRHSIAVQDKRDWDKRG
jgi:hypothetical protein